MRNIITTAEAEIAAHGKTVHIQDGGARYMEDRHGFTKEGHGKYYILVGDFVQWATYIDKAWDRRCDASRWAKRAGAKEIQHWYSF